MNDPAVTIPGHNIVLPTGGFRVDIQTQDSTELARHRRWRDTVLFGVSLGLFSTIFLVSMWIAFLTDRAEADARRAATGIVVTLIGALGGFLGGRGTK